MAIAGPDAFSIANATIKGPSKMLMAKKELKNFINSLEESDKAERILSGGCRKCFQVGLHMTGCDNNGHETTFGFTENEPSIPASKAI